MKSLLKKIFIDNWQRKLLALILSLIVWVFINHSLSNTKTISNVGVRVINLGEGRTIKGIQRNGILSESATLHITGNNNILNQISASDLEVLLDLKDQDKDFTAIITKEHIISKNAHLNIDRAIKKIKPHKLNINFSKLVKEKIDLLIAKPIGEVPKGYQFLDVWPNKFYITVSGPEEVVKNIKAKGLQLCFNLSDISEKELSTIETAHKRGKKDVVSFFVPTFWKKINISDISSYPLEIDDPKVKALRIDFIKKDFIPINTPIEVDLFFPLKSSDKLNPNEITLANNDFVKKINGINQITTPLYAQGISELFMDIIKEKMHIVILVEQKEDSENLEWNIQPVLPLELEKVFVKKLLSEETEEESKEHHSYLKEEYLNARFRAYLNRFRLWLSSKEKLNLKITLENNQVVIVSEKK
ncbi:MAG: hypothetical protein K940chlam1_00623 [Candidatus Anoxychlamydiales bacterium]|nr:hypothetical protein [Candidatus Anoxychlamydiales bacterium]NGX36076.1 hypothetical protein [Candidatus Anoxychlamydiales bacterium]